MNNMEFIYNPNDIDDDNEDDDDDEDIGES